eukprot:2274182-Rhodomonas_salina.1
MEKDQLYTWSRRASPQGSNNKGGKGSAFSVPVTNQREHRVPLEGASFAGYGLRSSPYHRTVGGEGGSGGRDTGSTLTSPSGAVEKAGRKGRGRETGVYQEMKRARGVYRGEGPYLQWGQPGLRQYHLHHCRNQRGMYIQHGGKTRMK